MSSSTIYNHRTLQPSGPPAPSASQQQSHTRLNESFEAIRHEFDAVAAELSLFRSQKEELEAKVVAQVNELTKIHQSFYDLEAQHNKVRTQYDEEVHRLRAELHAVRQGIAPHPPVGPGSIGLPGPLVLQPYGADPYYARDRERERDKEREREQRERDRERDRVERERETESRDRERDRVRGGVVEPDFKRGLGDRGPSDRDPKRFKQDRIKNGPEHFSPSLGPGMTPKLPPPPSSSSAVVLSPTGPGSSHPPAISEPPLPPHAGTLVPIGSGTTSFPDDLDIHTVPPELKKEGSDWFAIFNPNTKRVLDVSLVHTLMHESVVCCVRFSADGKYLATGCNRTAQIYDTKTGAKTCVLVDESAGKAGDLYIRSVCFSPDGKLLATGAEDKQIRIWDIQKKRIRSVFDGHQQEIYSLDFSADGRLIVSGSGDKTARIWDMHDGSSKVLTINDPDSLNNDAGVTSVAISPNGQLVAAGSLDTVVRIWDVATAQLVERLRGHRDSVYSVAFTPDGKGLVSGSLDKTLKYWDVSGLVAGVKSRKEGAGANGAGPVNGPGGAAPVVRKDGEKGSQCTMNFTGHKDYVLSVAVSHDGQWVVSGSKDRGVQFWDSRTAIVQCMLQGHKNSVISIDLSPAGSILATGSGDWQARIWSYNTI
ncbi:putative anaphase-promoting complex subunit 4 WD40 domain [Lyophyllum shimeji]|uniref:Anaphase-promoting complex subunit 4 WD40 domain n=1 Tax=Lyophyllum shimeji TaxID=47721 RepID=A0A9P3Q1R2_LYOSH|nr:putative anaphase-promoting complex subunit 4 WD40 domain [Lyophyllum shimeji]